MKPFQEQFIRDETIFCDGGAVKHPDWTTFENQPNRRFFQIEENRHPKKQMFINLMLRGAVPVSLTMKTRSALFRSFFSEWIHPCQNEEYEFTLPPSVCYELEQQIVDCLFLALVFGDHDHCTLPNRQGQTLNFNAEPIPYFFDFHEAYLKPEDELNIDQVITKMLEPYKNHGIDISRIMTLLKHKIAEYRNHYSENQGAQYLVEAATISRFKPFRPRRFEALFSSRLMGVEKALSTLKGSLKI